MPDIHVSAAVIVDEAGRVLVVRKQGTSMFMQPGGKPEAGESAAQTLIRELHEELGLELDEADLQPLGSFVSAAANEPGHRVIAEAFATSVDPQAVTVRRARRTALDHPGRHRHTPAGAPERRAPAPDRLARVGGLSAGQASGRCQMPCQEGLFANV